MLYPFCVHLSSALFMDGLLDDLIGGRWAQTHAPPPSSLITQLNSFMISFSRFAGAMLNRVNTSGGNTRLFPFLQHFILYLYPPHQIQILYFAAFISRYYDIYI